MRIIYLLIIKIYRLLITIAAIFNPKAKKWINGRKKWKQLLKQNKKTNNWVWFHVSSLGEFEQARPLIEKIKQKHLYKILLTFFSPSGYEIQKNYKYADLVMYLPLDTPQNAKIFIETLQPKAVFFAKYDIWYFFLEQIKKQNINAYLFSAIFRKNQIYFKWYGRWYAKALKAFKIIFVQDETSVKLLQKIGITNTIIAGDTRFDRVIEIAEKSPEIPIVKRFTENNFCVVAGSTWYPDEKIIAQFLSNNRKIKFIIAPHNIDNDHIKKLEKLLTCPFVKFSEATDKNIAEKQVLIIDNIGMLSTIYKYAQTAYIGGGFTDGIHNILEAAVYGIPVIFGPKYHKFKEAKDLIAIKTAFSIKNYQELKKILTTFAKNQTKTKQIGLKTKYFVYKNKGATQKILNNINL